MNTIGDVSSGKTEAMDFTLKPFEELYRKAVEQYMKDFEKFEDIAALSVKDRREAGFERLPKPKCSPYIVKDSTSEALNQVHSINLRGLMILTVTQKTRSN